MPTKLKSAERRWQSGTGSFQLIQLIKATNYNLYAAFAKLKSGVTPDMAEQSSVFLTHGL